MLCSVGQLDTVSANRGWLRVYPKHNKNNNNNNNKTQQTITKGTNIAVKEIVGMLGATQFLLREMVRSLGVKLHRQIGG